MKTSANGQDWGADGRIRTVTRGKRVISVNETSNKLEIKDHGLFTGDLVNYTPFVN